MEDRVVPANLMLVVDTELDVDGPNDGVTGLREAIRLAQEAGAGPHMITFANTMNGKVFKLGDAGTEIKLTKTITIDGLGKNITVERDATKGDISLFEVQQTAVASIIGLKLQKGGGTLVFHGGAVVSSGNLTLQDCTFQNNAASFGGGLSVTDANVTANSGVVIQENTANLAGGGIYIRKVNAEFAPIVELTGATVSANTAAFTGGGIHLLNGDLRLDGALICCNNAVNNFSEATRGGGVFAADGTNVIAKNNPTIASNSAMTGDGLYLEVGAARTGTSTYVEDSEYDGNPA